MQVGEPCEKRSSATSPALIVESSDAEESEEPQRGERQAHDEGSRAREIGCDSVVMSAALAGSHSEPTPQWPR